MSDLLFDGRIIALYPGDGDDGCFSGSAIVWQDKLWLLYTGFSENGGGENIRQLQCLASSDDGVHFTKHGVVIGEKDLPAEYSPCDFRDPKVWRKDGWFWCIVAARAKDGGVGLINLTAIIALNLGVMNLLPLPALDGGRSVFLLFELVFRRPVPPKYEGYVHAAGLALLMLLMAFVTYNDIVKIFFK